MRGKIGRLLEICDGVDEAIVDEASEEAARLPQGIRCSMKREPEKRVSRFLESEEENRESNEESEEESRKESKVSNGENKESSEERKENLL